MDSRLEQLARYVYQQLQQGVSEQNIRAALAQNKWTQDWIDAVFNVVHQNPTMFNAPSIQPLQRSEPLRPTFAPAVESRFAPEPQPAATPKKRKKHLLLVFATVVVLVGLAVGAYFVFQPKQSKQQAAPSPDIAQEAPKQTKAPDEERKDNLNTLLSDLADFYVAHTFYPTYDTLSSKVFADQNPTFDTKAFADPKWSADNAACTKDGKAIPSAKPTPFCYAYSATTSEGAACDNIKLFCTRMTVVATLDDGNPYPITLDRNTEIEN